MQKKYVARIAVWIVLRTYQSGVLKNTKFLNNRFEKFACRVDRYQQW